MLTFAALTKGTEKNHDAPSDCVDCPVLQYSPFVGHFEGCYLCLTAKTTGSSECDGCNPGLYKESKTDADGNKTDLCMRCPIGQYSAKQNSKSCPACPFGYFANNDPSPDGNITFNKCAACPRGKHGVLKAAHNESTGCMNCDRGKYSDKEGISMYADTNPNNCTGCPKGKYSEAVGVKKESSCIECGPGKHGSIVVGASNSTSCIECERGRIGTTVGAFVMEKWCTKCPTGYVQNLTGQR